MVCKESTQTSEYYYCLPLNMLEILQRGPCLQICRRRLSGTELVVWANLKFSTFERAYISLRSLFLGEGGCRYILKF